MHPCSNAFVFVFVFAIVFDLVFVFVMIPLPQTYFLPPFPPSLPSNTRLTGKLVAVRGKRDRGNQGRGLSDQIEHRGGISI